MRTPGENGRHPPAPGVTMRRSDCARWSRGCEAGFQARTGGTPEAYVGARGGATVTQFLPRRDSLLSPTPPLARPLLPPPPPAPRPGRPAAPPLMDAAATPVPASRESAVRRLVDRRSR